MCDSNEDKKILEEAKERREFYRQMNEAQAKSWKIHMALMDKLNGKQGKGK